MVQFNIMFLSFVMFVAQTTRTCESSPVRITRDNNNELVKMSICDNIRINQEMWEALCGHQGTGKRSDVIQGGEMIQTRPKHVSNDSLMKAMLNNMSPETVREWFRLLRKAKSAPETESSPLYII